MTKDLKLCISLVLAITACSSSGDNSQQTETDAALPTPSLGPADFSGARIEIIESSSRLSQRGWIQAALYSYAYPSIRRERQQIGDCILFEDVPAFCSTLCEDGVCVETDECVQRPDLRNAGTLTVRAGSESIAMERDLTGLYSSEFDLEAFRGAPTIHVEASGGEVAAFATSVSPFPAAAIPEITDVPSSGDWLLQWPAAPGDRVRLEMGNDLHGGGASKRIICDVPDRGELRVAGELLDQARFRVSGFCGECPTQILLRYRSVLVDEDLTVVVGTSWNFLDN